MKTIKQLLRQPLKTAIGIVIVALAFAILVTCVGQYTATDLTRENLDDRYTTIAMVTGKYLKQSNYSTGYADPSKISGMAQDWLTSLIWNRKDIVEKQSYTGLVSAYIPQLTIDNFDNYKSGYHMGPTNEGYPYRCAMLTVKLTKIGTIGIRNVTYYGAAREDREEFLNYTTYLCVGTVESVVALEKGFTPPVGKNIVLHIKVFDQAAYEALNLQVGQTYLVYGDDYIGQNDWAKENSMYCNSADDNYLPAHEELFGKVPEFMGVKSYKEMMSQFDCVLTVCDPCEIPIYTLRGTPSGGSMMTLEKNIREYYDYFFEEKRVRNERVSTAEFSKYYKTPMIEPLNGTVEDFLASEEGALWQEKLDEIQINNHGFPVLCVEKLGYQAVFAREQARIVEGRDFSGSELANGEKVCIISQTVAEKSGIKVGDTITMQTYGYDPTYEIYRTDLWQGYSFPSAAIYSKRVGFTSLTEEYTVVGLYRQEDAWQNYYDTYGFTPNTIFVPQSSVSSRMIIREKGIYSTLVIENGKRPELEALLAEGGYSDLLICYDQGYSEFVASLDAYEEVSQKALYIGIAAFAAITLLFLFLYPAQQKRALLLMGTLGASAWGRFRHTFVSILCVLVPGAALGGYAGSKLWTRIAAALMEWINIEIALESDMTAIAPKLTAASLAVVALAALLVSAALCRNRGLMKRK